MAAAAAVRHRRGRFFVTPEEYLARECEAATRSEYIAGEILAMSGGTPTHNRLAADAPVTLSVRLRAAGSGCNAVGSGQRVRVEGADPFFYPGVTVFPARTRRSTPPTACAIPS